MKEYKVKLIFDSTTVNAPGGSVFGGRQGGTKSDPIQNRVLPPVAVSPGGLGAGAAAGVAGAISAEKREEYVKFKKEMNDLDKEILEAIISLDKDKVSELRKKRTEKYSNRIAKTITEKREPRKKPEKSQTEKLKDGLKGALDSVLKVAKGDFKGGAEGFSKIFGGGKAGKALGWAAVAATLTTALIKLTQAVWGLNNKFSQYSNTAAEAQAKQEMFMNKFGKAMGAMTGPLSNIFTSLANMLLPLISALSEILGVVFNLLDIVVKLADLILELSGVQTALRLVAALLSYVNMGLKWLSDQLEKLLNFFRLSPTNQSLLISEMGRVSGVDPNKPLPNNPNNPSPAPVPNPNNPQPNAPQPIPAPVAAAASPAFYFGMMNNIETRRHVDDAVAKMREQLLYSLNKCETEQEMFVNELKSVNYIKTL